MNIKYLMILVIFLLSSCSHSIYLETYADIKAERYTEALEKIDNYNKEENYEDPKLLRYKAYILYKFCRFEEAIDILESQMKKTYDDEVVQGLLLFYKEYAFYLESKNRKERSIDYYKKYIKLSERILKDIL